MAGFVATLGNVCRAGFNRIITRNLSCAGDVDAAGLVLGVYNEDTDPNGEIIHYTKASDEFNKKHDGRLADLIKLSGPVPKKGDVRIFYDLDKRYSAVAVVGMGDECVSYKEVEQMDEWKEAIRLASATGAKALQELAMRIVFVESFGHAESSAEGCAMGVWMFQELKSAEKQKPIPRLELYEDCDYTGWQIGLQKAAAQNLARQLTETPANLLTPISFAKNAVDFLCKAGVNVELKGRDWAKIMDMNGFMAAAGGSCEPPIFLEASYYGCEPDVSPAVLIGKGVTFDSGGLCIKHKEEMKHMRGDMAGAAAVLAACRAVSALQLPINVRCLCPLFENMPGPCAMKPGDIVRAKNGKSILIETTDFDGRLALADTLSYSALYNPKFILDVGTVTTEMMETLGGSATGVFSNSEPLYEQLRVASIHTGDRIWRLPLWQHFTEKVTTGSTVDVGDIRRGMGAPCTAAAFLREFVPACDWIHLDTYGVNRTDGVTYSYLRRGMSGRPTRTLVEFLAQFACKSGQESG